MENTLQPESILIQQSLTVKSEDLLELRSQATHLQHDLNSLRETIERTVSMDACTQRLHNQLFERLGQALLTVGASMQPTLDVPTGQNSE